MNDLERLKAELLASAHESLARCLRSGGTIQVPLTVTASCGEFQVSVTLARLPAYEFNDRLTDCEKDLLVVLHSMRTPATLPRILKEFDQRGIIHGESTARHALPKLIAAGWIASNRCSPRGYFPLRKRDAATCQDVQDTHND